MRYHVVSRISLVLSIAIGIVLVEASFESEALAAQRKAAFRALDDVQFDPSVPIDALLAAIECVDGAFTGNPIQPCTDGSRLRLRNAPFQSVIHSADPRFDGIVTLTANANLDPSYAGLVWGQWNLELTGGGGAWHGVWFGRRTVKPKLSAPLGSVWFGKVSLIGYGSGSVDGLTVKARERLVTYTPFPLPYEALLLFGLSGVCPDGVCPPEGIIRGQIKRDR